MEEKCWSTNKVSSGDCKGQHCGVGHTLKSYISTGIERVLPRRLRVPLATWWKLTLFSVPGTGIQRIKAWHERTHTRKLTVWGEMTKNTGWAFLMQKSKVLQNLKLFFFFFFFFLVVLGLELRAYTLSHSTQPIFVMEFFELGSHKLFAQAIFEPWSSWSLPPK
jgi:hypothetical protein